MITKEELRSMAVSVGLEVPQAATLMMGAADVIDRLEAENAKLRQLVLDYDSSLNEALRLAHVQGTATIGDLTQIDNLRLRRLELGVVACDD